MSKEKNNKLTNKRAHILFQSRLDLFDRPGGDTVQMVETKNALEKLGVDVEIKNTLSENLEGIDIVHVFNLDWVSEPYWQVENALKQKVPVVLSPIHHSLDEYKLYEKKNRYGLAKIGNFIIPYQPLRDSARNILKGLTYTKKLRPAIKQVFMGIRNQQRYCVNNSDIILVQTVREAEDLKEEYKTNDFKWKKVINGVNVKKFTNTNSKGAKKYLPKNPYILCVGRVEPRKNQLMLIQALKQLREYNPNFRNMELFFAGSFNNHHPTYLNKFKQEVKKNSFIHYPGFLDQDILANIFSKATIFAVPSWFETTGLVYLEAIVAGCTNIVASGERAQEYLGKNAVYCDPTNINSIENALKEAFKPTVSKGFRKEIVDKYNWENTAKQTFSVYKDLLNGKIA